MIQKTEVLYIDVRVKEKLKIKSLGAKSQHKNAGLRFISLLDEERFQ